MPRPVAADQRKTEPEDQAIYAEIAEGPSIPDLTFQRAQDLPEAEQAARSAKDRMLLSTGDASCLLFTQTVTSPMLTPSEENVDFLKGFQQRAGNPEEAEAEFAKVFTEPIYENVDGVKDDDERIYENVGARDEPDESLETGGGTVFPIAGEIFEDGNKDGADNSNVTTNSIIIVSVFARVVACWPVFSFVALISSPVKMV